MQIRTNNNPISQQISSSKSFNRPVFIPCSFTSLFHLQLFPCASGASFCSLHARHHAHRRPPQNLLSPQRDRAHSPPQRAIDSSSRVTIRVRCGSHATRLSELHKSENSQIVDQQPRAQIHLLYLPSPALLPHRGQSEHTGFEELSNKRSAGINLPGIAGKVNSVLTTLLSLPEHPIGQYTCGHHISDRIFFSHDLPARS